MTTITVDDMKRDAAGYFGCVQAGESLLVLQADQPIAEITPVAPAEEASPRPLRPSGLAEGDFTVPDDFDAPLPEEILRLFERR